MSSNSPTPPLRHRAAGLADLSLSNEKIFTFCHLALASLGVVFTVAYSQWYCAHGCD